MNRAKIARALGISLIAVVVLIAGAALAFGGNNQVESATASTSNVASATTDTQPVSATTTTTAASPTTTTTVATIPPKVADDLTVNTSDLLPDAAKCQNDGFIANSLAPVVVGDNTKRQASDDVSTPYVATDDAGKIAETYAENCGNPTFLDMSVKAIGDITIAGWNVREHNPWMSEFSKTAGQGFRATFLTKKQGHGDEIFVTSEMQQYAALVNTLLTRLQVVGVVTEQSVANWHLLGDGLQAGELPVAVLNTVQDGLPVLRLEVTDKVQGCVEALGFNIQDMRFETLSCPVPPPTTPVVTTPPTPGPTTTTPSSVPTQSTQVVTTTTTAKPCAIKGCQVVPSTVAAPAITAPPAPTTTVAPVTVTQTTVQAGDGATSVSTPPSTVAPKAVTPSTGDVGGPPPTV